MNASMRKLSLHSLTLSIAVLLSACAVGPDFSPPEPQEPPRWGEPARVSSPGLASTDAVDEQWWLRFNDPVLTQLIERARAANPDIRTAMLRVEESRVQRRIAGGGAAPTLSTSASYQRQRQSEHGTATRMIEVIAPPSNQDAIIGALSEPYDVYQAGFDAAWELDLWGRVRRTIEAASARQDASLADLRSMKVSVIAETARTYFELRGVEQQLRISADDVSASASALELTQVRARGGLVTQLDVVTQQARLADARGLAPALEHRRTQLANALAILLGEAPGALDQLLAAPQVAAEPPPEVAIGVASDVARRRPDIRAAESRLHAATAEIGVATADLYPRFTLTGGFLLESLDAADLTEWGSRQWSIGPSLSLPLFDGGRRRGAVELRKLQQQEAAVDYQRTVLRAWREIDDALSAYAAERLRNRELADALAASREAYEIAGVRYEHGLVNFLVALDAQRTLLQAQRAYSDSNTALRTHLVALYKALGGGWRG
jgi:NodT family efflux transporter outer membrane factor (OMF) lipoprotein